MAWLALIRNAPGCDEDVDYDDYGHHDGDGPVELDALLEVVLGCRGIYFSIMANNKRSIQE